MQYVSISPSCCRTIQTLILYLQSSFIVWMKNISSELCCVAPYNSAVTLTLCTEEENRKCAVICKQPKPMV